MGLSETTLRRNGIKVANRPGAASGAAEPAAGAGIRPPVGQIPPAEAPHAAAAVDGGRAGSGADADIGHRWSPIGGLDAADIAAGDAELPARVDRWHLLRAGIDPQKVRGLDDQIKREWAIETGVIELLYTLDDTTTRRLVTDGVDVSSIPAGASDQPPEAVAAMIEDHADTVDWLHDLADGTRPLSTSLIKQLHQFMTRQQRTAAGFDIFGRRREIPLLHGAFKTRPNNPRRAGDRKVHQYCPPEQVDSEMDRLIEEHHAHAAQQVPPDVGAAWLHHRFVQIHPFQDGNGRVGRAVASLALIQARWFPLVVTRHDRGRYLETLACADNGDLAPLVALTGDLQNRCLDRAFGLSSEPEHITGL